MTLKDGRVGEKPEMHGRICQESSQESTDLNEILRYKQMWAVEGQVGGWASSEDTKTEAPTLLGDLIDQRRLHGRLNSPWNEKKKPNQSGSNI